MEHVKSNAIVVANGYHTLGIGVGRMNRVRFVKLALLCKDETNRNAYAEFRFTTSVVSTN